MLNRIFLLLLAIAAIVMWLGSFYAHSWLGSIGDPAIASDGFVFHTTFAWTFLWLSFLVLALVSLVLTWKTGAKWAVISTFAYFVVSSLLLLFNDSTYREFLAENSMTASYTLLNPFFIAVIFLVLAIALVAAFMVTTRIRVKIVKEEKNSKEEKNDEEKTTESEK